MKTIKFRTYEYPIKIKDGFITGSYTIREGVEPLHYENEKLVNEFEAMILDKSERYLW